MFVYVCYQVTLAKVIAQQEGSIEEEEEDLATPGTSKKRAAPGEGDLFETPKAKRPATTQQMSGKSLFHRVTKYNVKDKNRSTGTSGSLSSWWATTSPMSLSPATSQRGGMRNSSLNIILSIPPHSPGT